MNWKFWKRQSGTDKVVKKLMTPDISKLGDYIPQGKPRSQMTREECNYEAMRCFEKTIELCGDVPSLSELKKSAMNSLAKLYLIKH